MFSFCFFLTSSLSNFLIIDALSFPSSLSKLLRFNVFLSAYAHLNNKPSLWSCERSGKFLSIVSLHHISWYFETSSASVKLYLFLRSSTFLINLSLFFSKSKSLPNLIICGGITVNVSPTFALTSSKAFAIDLAYLFSSPIILPSPSVNLIP